MTAKKKTRLQGLFFILDGLGDLPVARLGGKTPLEAAKTPHLDHLAGCGVYGMVDPVIPGIPADTHIGIALLLGVSTDKVCRLHRGPLEAAGAGVDFEDGDVAVRCNFATLEHSGGRLIISDRRAGRISAPDTTELAGVLQNIDLGNGVTGSVFPATQHRAVLRLSGPGLSDAISDSDPRHGNPMQVQTVQPLLPDDRNSRQTADAMNHFSRIAHERLFCHPLNTIRRAQGKPEANTIICRGAGAVSELKTVLHDLHLKVAIVTGSCTVVGLGRMLDYPVFTSPDFTALADTDIAGKISTAFKLLQKHDLVFVHLKAPDICAHDFDPEGKRDFIERFDLALSTIREKNLVIAVTADHSTDSNSGEHSRNPVPSLLYTPGDSCDSCNSCQHFGEHECRQGPLGTMPADLFLRTFLASMRYPDPPVPSSQSSAT
jgi:2,3-bisphosphoglycerate-independent phosphoglycerate mutase